MSTKTQARFFAIFGAGALLAAAAGSSCGGGDLPSDTTSSSSSSSGGTTETMTGTGGKGTGGAGGAADCSTSPTTHLEIINACTDAQKIEAAPVLPLLGADGSLPPLP